MKRKAKFNSEGKSMPQASLWEEKSTFETPSGRPALRLVFPPAIVKYGASPGTSCRISGIYHKNKRIAKRVLY